MVPKATLTDFVELVGDYLAQVPEDSIESMKLQDMLNEAIDDPDRVQPLYAQLTVDEADVVERDCEDDLQAAITASTQESGSEARATASTAAEDPTDDEEMNEEIAEAIRLSLEGDASSEQEAKGANGSVAGEEQPRIFEKVQVAEAEQGQAEDDHAAMSDEEDAQLDALWDELNELSDQLQAAIPEDIDMQLTLAAAFEAVEHAPSSLQILGEQVELLRGFRKSLEAPDNPESVVRLGSEKSLKGQKEVQHPSRPVPPVEPPHIRRLTLLLGSTAPTTPTQSSEVRTLAQDLRSLLLSLLTPSVRVTPDAQNRLIVLASLVTDILEFANTPPVDTVNPTNDEDRMYQHRFFAAWQGVQTAMTSYFINRVPEAGEAEGFAAIVDVFNGAIDAMTRDNHLAGAFAEWREGNRKAAEEWMDAEVEKDTDDKRGRKRRQRF